MAPEGSTRGPDTEGDDLDDLFDYNVNMEDIFRDVNVSMTIDNEKEVSRTKSKDGNLGLGIDEEIKVLWLDDLYPRAKFADGLAMIEKLGHTKRMQTMRREWINEGKPREKYNDAAVPQQTQEAPAAGKERREQQSAASDYKTPAASDIHQSPAFSDEVLYSGQPQDRLQRQPSPDATDTLFLPDDDGDDQPAEDDLDALLAEADVDNQKNSNITSNQSSRQKHGSSARRDSFDDEMEAMAEMEDIR
ncbi:MAG: hypothetical protein Q9179_005336 [Wetmoreana sp. 5 TL-2023]